MAIIHAKPVPVQLTVNSLAYDAMTQAAAARGLTFSRYASQLLEAAWSARVKPTGDDVELETAVAAPPPRDSQTAQKLVERTNDAERRLREANAKVERLERDLAKRPEQPMKTGPVVTMDEHQRALAARDAQLRREVAAVGDKMLAGERWRVAFERTRRRMDKIAGNIAALQTALAARNENRDPHPSKYRAQADALPASIAKGIRSMLGMGVSIADVAAQYDVPADVVRTFKK